MDVSAIWAGAIYAARVIVRGIELNGFAIGFLPVEYAILTPRGSSQTTSQYQSDVRFAHVPGFDRSRQLKPSTIHKTSLRM